MFEGHGSWLSHIIIDDKEMWHIKDEVPSWDFTSDDLGDGSKRMVSDTYKREDAELIRQEKWEQAEDTKFAMEEVQRNDKKLR